MNESELTAIIEAWVMTNSVAPTIARPVITPDTDLIGSGLVDSLGLVDLLLHLEVSTGYRVDLADADPSQFGTVQGLCRLVLDGSR